MKNEGRFFIFVNQNINPTASTTLLNPKFLVLSNWFDLLDSSMTHSLTCQLLVVFPAVFDQFSSQFSNKDNSVGFKVFQILTSGCWCFKSAQKIAPATVG